MKKKVPKKSQASEARHKSTNFESKANVSNIDVDMEHDPDPIKASYDVYIKPHISEDRQIFILQFPNRDSKQQYSAAHGAMPISLRVKPEAAMVEMDVPMDAYQNYDREKGARWGDAMLKSKGGIHGLPGGFGIGGTTGGRGRGKAVEEDDIGHRRVLADYPTAVRDSKVLIKQTLGGQAVPGDETTPQYMVGTFRNDQLHLTPIDNIVQMRPQFHHIDAHAELERKDRAGPAMPGGQARAVHMTVKSSTDGEEETSETMAQRITAVQSEAWISHQYIDEGVEASWNVYEEGLFVGGKEDPEEKLKNLPKLFSALDNSEYLDSICAPRNATKLPSRRIKKEKADKGKQPALEGAADEPEGAESDTYSNLEDPPSDEEPEQGAQ